MISDMSSCWKSVSQQVLSGGGSGTSHRLQTNPERGKEGKKKNPQQLTVEPDVVHGQDDGSVGLGDPLHGAVDPSIGSLHIVLLQVQRKAIYTPSKTHTVN